MSTIFVSFGSEDSNPGKPSIVTAEFLSNKKVQLKLDRTISKI